MALRKLYKPFNCKNNKSGHRQLYPPPHGAFFVMKAKQW